MKGPLFFACDLLNGSRCTHSACTITGDGGGAVSCTAPSPHALGALTRPNRPTPRITIELQGNVSGVPSGRLGFLCYLASRIASAKAAFH